VKIILRELEEQDIITRKIYAEVPPRVEYSITEYGRSLYDILQNMHKWGVAHMERMAKKHADLLNKEVDRNQA
jgi:DNA-binding HxlR family transcriptional regulator